MVEGTFSDSAKSVAAAAVVVEAGKPLVGGYKWG